MGDAAGPLLRNIALAALLAPSDFGIAIALTVVIGIIEILSDVGLPVYVIRRPMGWRLSETLATLHTLALVRACLLGAILTVSAPVLASLLQAEAATASFALLGIIAALRGFENLGVKALLRTGRYTREATVLATSQILLVSVTVLAAAVTQNHTCIVWGLLAHALGVVVLSHVLSRRRWYLGWNAKLGKEVLTFGWPMLLNGAAAAAASGDRFIVGNVLGPAALAHYSVAVGSAMLPKSVLSRFLTSTFVPRFARAAPSQSRTCILADSWAFCLSAMAFGIGLALAIWGGPVLGLIFGAAYQPTPPFMAALGFAVAIRILLLLPVPLSIARGDTRMVAGTSLASAIAVLISAPVLIATESTVHFLLAQATVEYAALAWFVWRALDRHAFRPALLAAVVLAPPALLAMLAIAATNVGARIEPAAATAAVAVLSYVAGYAAIRQAFRIEVRAAVR